MAPKTFYRVQSAASFTIYDSMGFDAPGNFKTMFMRYSIWLNKVVIERHLDWSSRTSKLTPFISVFDNWADAEARAKFLVKKGHRDVFVAEICVPQPEQTDIRIRHRDNTVQWLPILEDDDGHTRVAFLSTADARKYLGVDVRVSQLSEWFAITPIPQEMIEWSVSFCRGGPN